MCNLLITRFLLIFMSNFSLNTAENNVSNNSDNKDEAYKRFCRFSKYTNRKGRTLASSGEIKFLATKSLVAGKIILLRFHPAGSIVGIKNPKFRDLITVLINEIKALVQANDNRRNKIIYNVYECIAA